MPNIFIKHLAEPWFSLTKLGIKKCEGRLNKGDFANIEIGDNIIFVNEEFDFKREITVEITCKTIYPIFHDYLEKEGPQHCLPGINSINHGVSIYRRYYSIEEEQKNKVVGLRFNLI